MGVKITKGKGFDVRLEKIADKTTRNLRRVQRDGAYAMADTVKDMVPFKEGDLEASVEVHESIGAGRRKVFNIMATAKHAVYMHEGVYDLGPGSLQKQQTSQHVVGRKFMDRATNWLIRDWRIMDKARAAVKSGKKGAK